ncbi:hypothetical protein DM01DRAFT_1385836 [Hesseltinella vesiculosa]|uniref:Uncharacterized protein n=1 Tax=Hesseltinella vesiculosa TaxID=101127 RepID=A0A1X2G812_9FUNG|nr:hypothetical protein DM01DRAFT_1385836 [Hesseltinella vesiculosa]
MTFAVHTFKIGLRQLIEDQKQQYEHHSDVDEAPAPKRQRTGTSKTTAKRKQNFDEKREKQDARDAFHRQLEKHKTTPDCPTCLSAAEELERNNLPEAAKERRRLAKTHSRSTSKACPGHVDQQRVKTKALLGVTKTYTLKHGLANLIKPLALNPEENSAEPSADQNEDEFKSSFIDAMEKVVDYNRDMTIMACNFALFFLSGRAQQGIGVPAVCFTPVFFSSIFQLLLGKIITNKTTISDRLNQDLSTCFSAFKDICIGQAQDVDISLPLCSPLASPIASHRPITLTGSVLSSTANECAKNLKNHVVEGFDGYAITYIQADLQRRMPDLGRIHCRGYATYIYATIASDPKFPPTWPEYKSINDELVSTVKQTQENIASDFRRLLQHAFDLIDRDLQLEREQREEAGRRRRYSIRRQTNTPAIASSSSSASFVLAPSTSTSSHDSLQAAQHTDDDAMSMDTNTNVTIGTLGLTAAHIEEDDATGNPRPDRFAITTATLTRFPHHFFSAMANMLKNLEAWNSSDQEQEPSPQQRASPAWTRHFLAELPEWKKLRKQKRSRLTFMLTKMINDNVPLATSRLSPQFSPQSLDVIRQKVESAKHQIAAGTIYQARSPLVHACATSYLQAALRSS